MPLHPAVKFKQSNVTVDNETNAIIYQHFANADVYVTLKKLKPKHTMRPAFILRDCAGVIYTPLTYIFNITLEHRRFPSLLKQSKAIPAFKRVVTVILKITHV